MKTRSRGVALFILLTSMLILSLSMREIFQMVGLQTDRVRYNYDRLQAIYLARSSLNLARFFLLYDYQIDQQVLKENATDSEDDLWAKPLPFPIPVELIQGMAGKLAEGAGLKEKGDSKEKDSKNEDLVKQCQDFFSDFTGNAVSQTIDLNARINLNDLKNKDVYEALIELLQIKPEFVSYLQQRGISAESLAREIRDYSDDNEIEDETNSPEADVYRSEQLTYTPKNRAFTNWDELKMVPSVDDEIFEYLSPLVSSVYIAPAKPPAKINLNTVGKEVFQAMLKGVSDPMKVSEDFLKDRKEKGRRYTDKDYAKTLADQFGLDNDKIRLNLLSGRSSAFKIEVNAQVNQVQVTLEAYTGRGVRKPVDPLVMTRISP